MLNRKTYVVRERVGFMKLTDVYDLLDPDSGQPIGIAKEEPSNVIKYLRLVVKKRWMPTRINVYETESAPPLLSIHRGPAFLHGKVHVHAGNRLIGTFKPKWISLGPSFRIFDAQEQEIGSVKGDWKGWNFTVLSGNGAELGKVTKKWGGVAKELFTNADTYVIALGDAAMANADTAQLLLAAGLAIDTVFKEHDG